MVLPAAAMVDQNDSLGTLVISIVSPNVQHSVIHGEIVINNYEKEKEKI